MIDPCVYDYDLWGQKIDYILLTHEHYDHISGVNDCKSVSMGKVICSEDCAERIRDPKKNMAHYFKAFCDIQTWTDEIPKEVDENYSCEADIVFKDRYEFTWCGHDVRFVHTPGHSPGSCAILIDDHNLFCGDSLIKGYEPTLRFPGGSRKKWKEISEPYFKSLSGDMRVYPGHFVDFQLSEYRW